MSEMGDCSGKPGDFAVEGEETCDEGVGWSCAEWML